MKCVQNSAARSLFKVQTAEDAPLITPHTPTGTPPALRTKLTKTPNFTHASTECLDIDVTNAILDELKDYPGIEIHFEHEFIRTLPDLLKTISAHNNRNYVETCKESNHFKEIFIAHVVEQLIRISQEEPEWSPTSENIKSLIEQVDEALKIEDDFQLNRGNFFSWIEQERADSPGILPDARAEDAVPSLIGQEAGGYATGDAILAPVGESNVAPASEAYMGFYWPF